MAEQATHGQLLNGAGQTAAGRVSLGTITLPAGGPWKIHTIHGSIVRATATAGEANTGFFDFAAQSGDVTPNILPNAFPVHESGSFLGATADQSVCPTILHDIDWQAAGKAVIEVGYTQQTTVTVAPQIVAGLIFGPDRPPIVIPQHSAHARLAKTTAADQAVGTITLPETAKQLVAVLGTIIQDNVLTTAEELTGFWRMTSDDFDLTPFQMPFSNVFGAGLGALIESAQGLFNRPIPVNVPVVGGSRLNVFAALNTAVTNGAEIDIYVFFI